MSIVLLVTLSYATCAPACLGDGGRSETVYKTLIGHGYQNVWVMEGGLEAWIAAGYPTVSD